MSPCALISPYSHLRMSKSSGSDLSDRPGDDSDGEGSVTSSCSHASEMPYTPDSKKRARPKQIRGKAWIFHGVITTDADRLHPKSGSNEEGPFPLNPFLISKCLLQVKVIHQTVMAVIRTVNYRWLLRTGPRCRTAESARANHKL